MNMKQAYTTLAAACFSVTMACGHATGNAPTAASAPPEPVKTPEVVDQKPTADGLYAIMDTDKGTITIALEYAKTPITVANFVGLATGKNPYVTTVDKTKPYFDGIVFHRVIADFMVQGGDPTASGRGGPGYVFPDEIDASLKHDKPGILSMANAGPGTNGSQFFITHKDTPWLDGKHTVFGHVVSGQDVVNRIAQGDKIKSVRIEAVGKEAKAFDAAKVLGEQKAKFVAR